MNTESPGFATLDPDCREVDEAILAADRVPLGFDAGLDAGARFSVDGEVFLAVRVVDGARLGVGVAGRFFFSGMPVEIIHQLADAINLTLSGTFAVELARTEALTIRD